jgi:uncharacterized protein
MMSGVDHLLALNNAHKVETGFLTREELTDMLGNAFHSATEGAGKDGLLIAFDQDGAYDSPNFLWFKARFDRFVYVDRIIVAPHARGRGLARVFYQGLFEAARTAGHVRVVCEINLDPPNPGSVAFHDAMGFVEVGQAVLENGKTVSYRELLLADMGEN